MTPLPPGAAMSALSAECARGLLRYDADTGIFTWRVVRGSSKIGAVAGKTDRHGYRVIQIDGRHYFAHRLAWLITTGEWPASNLDHINRVRSDNRLSNLREASPLENSRNRVCDGTRVRPQNGRKNPFSARIHILGKEVHLGTFPTKEAARAAYVEARTIHFGAFAATDEASS